MAEKQVQEKVKDEKDNDEPWESTCDQELGDCLQDTEKSTDELEDELTNEFYTACAISMQLMDDAKPGTSSDNTAEEVTEQPQISGLMTASSDTSIQIPWSEESLSKLVENMSDQAGNAMLTMMSKEMLYPILKAIAEMYPEWLIENKCKLSPNLYATYSNQYLLICEACEELEEESEDDTQTVKEARSEKVLDLVQQIQDCCEPPKELTSLVSASHLQEDPIAVELCLLM